MFCTFIFAVLLLKYCFPTSDQLQKYCASDFFLQYQADYNCYRVIAHSGPNFVAMATGIGGRKCDWHHSMAHPRKSPYRHKNLADISYTDRVLSQILFHSKGCRSENMQFAAFNGPSSKPLAIGAKIARYLFTQAKL